MADIPTKSLASEKEQDLTAENERAYQELSPFELKNKLIELATKYETKSHPYINAGRGNPDFFNTIARLALAKLITFAVSICDQEKEYNLGYLPSAKLVNKLFDDYFKNDDSDAGKFLKDAMDKAIKICKGDHASEDDKNEVVYELTNISLGDFYPDPPRIYPNVEKIVNMYLKNALLGNEDIPGKFDLFATEGATAGMIYVFKSLEENFLLNLRDKVAIVTPVFSPYLEIPQLNDYEFQIISLDTNEESEWELPDSELEKLKDESIKVLYLINPTNPSSIALSDNTINKLNQVVTENNPNLIIVVDAVYSTFVDKHISIIQKLPKNCITVYSFSKYFGVTGWRLGVIMLNENNVIDNKLLKEQPENWKAQLAERYGIDDLDVDDLKFIDRIVDDSRDVALAHTAGISGPQQAAMALFSLFDILDVENNEMKYRKHLWDLLEERVNKLYAPLGIEPPPRTQHTYYYCLIDILELASKKDKAFALYLLQNYYPVDFVFSLSIYTSSVCLPGYGFFEPEEVDYKEITPEDKNNWSIRVSIANQPTDYYDLLGNNIVEVLKKYYEKFKEGK